MPILNYIVNENIADVRFSAEKQKGGILMENNKTKSKAKAMGVKSTFNIEGNAVITTFGKGNKSIVEKRVENGVVHNIDSKQTIDIDVVHPKNETFNITKGRVSFPDKSTPAVYQPSSNNIKIAVGNRKISRKEELEKRFFGKTFNDNLHIQLIYNIMDLEKDLAAYSNTASFIVNNIFAVDSNDENYDIFTFLNTVNTYKVFRDPTGLRDDVVKNLTDMRERFDRLLDIRNNYEKTPRRENPRLSYYGNVFYTKNGKLRSNEDIYNSLAILGDIRNFVTDSLPNNRVSAIIYNLHTYDESFKKSLDSILGEMVKSLNKNFAKNNKVNYYILYSAYNCWKNYEVKNEITKEFYDFTVTKAFKNMGFSIKLIRESILNQFFENVKSKKYDSCRSKLYQLLDFSIYHYYLSNHERIEENVAQLRATLKEEDKEAFYVEEAKRLNEELNAVFNIIVKKTSPSNISKIDPDKVYVYEKCIKMLNTADFDYFSKMVYILTLYLDGKQINELLTSLINSFENINGFKDIIAELNLEGNFVSPYQFFNYNRTRRIAKELRIINSFAKMKMNDPNYKKTQYMDAIVVLGTDMSDKEISDEADRFLDVNVKNHNVRNFLANNVLKSNRYKYLIRYIRPSMAKSVISNFNIVKHVLKDIPDTQIERYYKSYFNTENAANAEIMREKLASALMQVKYDEFKNVKQKVKNGTEEAFEKERKKALVRLYLTVVYIFVKNLVQTNTRYVISFHFLEFDSKLFGYNLREKKSDSLGNPVYNKNYNFLTTAYINTANELYNAELSKPFKERKKVKQPINQRFCRILINNMPFASPYTSVVDEYSENPELRNQPRSVFPNNMIGDNANLAQSMIREFRNNVAHLNIVRTFDKNIETKDGKEFPTISLLGEFNTYFEAYHFLMQLQLTELTKRCGDKPIKKYNEIVELKNVLLKTHRYSKNTVKTLCTPFGYNLVRYKNLTINELFDKNAKQ